MSFKVPTWGKWVGGISALAALLTVVVYGRTIVSWFVPNQASRQYGELFCDTEDWPIRWPVSYAKASPAERQAFEKAEGFARIDLTNVSKLEIRDIKIALPVEAVIELASDSGDHQVFPPSDVFELGDLKVGQRIRTSIWMKRRFEPDEKITVTHQYGEFQVKPTLIMSLDEVEFYRQGFYELLCTTIVLALALLCLIIWVARRLRHKAKPPQPGKSKPTKPPRST